MMLIEEAVREKVSGELCASLVEVAGLTIRFFGEGTPRLQNADLVVEPSKPVALVGPSGSGKSIFLHALAGLLDNAEVRFERLALRLGGESREWVDVPYDRYRHEARPLLARAGACLFQDAINHLHPLRSVLEQLLEASGGDWEAVRRVCQEGDGGVGLLPLVDADEERAMNKLALWNASSLSGGMCQRVFIARALLKRPELLIADEPFTDIDRMSRRSIQSLLVRHFVERDAAGTVLLATHDLHFLAKHGFAGRGVVYQIDPQRRTFDRQTRVSPPPETTNYPTWRPSVEGRVLAAITAPATYRYPGEQKVSVHLSQTLEVRAGEILGVVGESGSGKSTLAKLLAKLVTGKKFGVDYPGLKTRGRNDLYHTVQVAFQDSAGTFNAKEIVEEILRRVLRLRGLDDRRIDLGEILELVNLEDPDPDLEPLPAKAGEGDGPEPGASPRSSQLNIRQKRPQQLSMGMQRRFSLVKALLSICSPSRGPRLVILDEVTRGLDTYNRQAVIDLLFRRDLGALNLPEVTYVVISHDLDFIRQVCHRIAVMFRGWMVEVAERETPGAPWGFAHPYSQQLFGSDSGELRPLRQRDGMSEATCPFFPYCPFVPRSESGEPSASRCSNPTWNPNRSGKSRYYCAVDNLGDD